MPVARTLRYDPIVFVGDTAFTGPAFEKRVPKELLRVNNDFPVTFFVFQSEQRQANIRKSASGNAE